jgi:hypothetical protein
MFDTIAAVGVGAALSGLTIARSKKNSLKIFENDTTPEFYAVGGATLALNGLGFFNWWMHYYKNQKGDIEIQGANAQYKKAMTYFWMMIMLVYLVSIVVGALDIHMVKEPEPRFTVDNELKGKLADTTYALSIANLSLVGLSALTYMYAIYGTGQEKSVTMILRSR